MRIGTSHYNMMVVIIIQNGRHQIVVESFHKSMPPKKSYPQPMAPTQLPTTMHRWIIMFIRPINIKTSSVVVTQSSQWKQTQRSMLFSYKTSRLPQSQYPPPPTAGRLSLTPSSLCLSSRADPNPQDGGGRGGPVYPRIDKFGWETAPCGYDISTLSL